MNVKSILCFKKKEVEPILYENRTFLIKYASTNSFIYTTLTQSSDKEIA